MALTHSAPHGGLSTPPHSDLAFGKDDTLHTHGPDKYGRTLADVRLPDGTNVNHTLVKDGWC
jgi:hypothetical protein